MAQGAMHSGRRLIELSWNTGWKGVRVRVDGAEVAGPLDEKAVRAGHEVTLDDGSRLRVNLAPYWGILHLQVRIDGHFIGATTGEAQEYLQAASYAFGLKALYYVILGLNQMSKDTPGAALDVVVGVVFALAGAFTFRGSRAALWGGTSAAILLLAAECLVGRQFPGIWSCLLILVLLRAIPASLEEARAREAEHARAQANAKAGAPDNPYRAPGV